MTCTHHWTVTSECPACLRTQLNETMALLRSYQLWAEAGEKMIANEHSGMFRLGEWWADRPWRERP